MIAFNTIIFTLLSSVMYLSSLNRLNFSALTVSSEMAPVINSYSYS